MEKLTPGGGVSGSHLTHQYRWTTKSGSQYITPQNDRHFRPQWRFVFDQNCFF